MTAKADKSKDYLIMCSYIELYNEELRDLLHLNDKVKLELRESPEKGIFIKELKKVPVTSSAEIFKYLKFGNQNRTTGETLMNSESSRSHSIFTIYAESM
jgi:kinesin family protein 3/17